MNAASNEPQTDGVLFPITLARETDVIPHAYIVHTQATRCACGTETRTNQVFALNFLRSRTEMGKYVRHLVPVTRLAFNVPVECVALQEKSIPLCHACVTTASLAHLPSPPAGDDGRVFGIGTLAEPQPAKPKGKRPNSLEDLA